jgi:hypothetical protein
MIYWISSDIGASLSPLLVELLAVTSHNNKMIMERITEDLRRIISLPAVYKVWSSPEELMKYLMKRGDG